MEMRLRTQTCLMEYLCKASDSIAHDLKCIKDDVERLVSQGVHVSLDEHVSYIVKSLPFSWQDSCMKFLKEFETYDQLKDLMYVFRTQLQEDI